MWPNGFAEKEEKEGRVVELAEFNEEEVADKVEEAEDGPDVIEEVAEDGNEGLLKCGFVATAKAAAISGGGRGTTCEFRLEAEEKEGEAGWVIAAEDPEVRG